MKRSVAAALISLVLLESPSCGNSDGGGSGDINHPNTRPIATSSPGPKNQKDYRNPNPKRSRWDAVLFQVGLNPPRKVTISWKINGSGKTLVQSSGQWTFAKDAKSGDVATLRVENHSEGGVTQCMIYVNGKLLVPNDDEAWNPYMHRNDLGDCTASVVVP